MNLRRFLAEAGTLVGLAVVCAFVSNALAGKERKLALPGDYPNALKVTSRAEAAPLPAGGAPQWSAAPETSPAPGPDVPASAAAGPGSTPQAQAPSPERTPVPRRSPGGASGATAPPVPPARASAGELLSRFPVHGQPFVEISGDQASWLHAQGALFLDARRSREYAGGHVPGAQSFPVWESEVVRERVEALVASGRDGTLPIVLYCSGGDCEDSHMLAQMLFGAGFENLLVYRDGLPDWVKRGGPVSTGGPA
jgi:rhodanese-related sulfurtransferase